MISFFKQIKKEKRNKGMTYVELIVVLSIFSVLATIAIYNYGLFEGKVDIKNLSNDMAQKFVQAQKDASYGKLPSLAQQASITPSWNPSYGLYFDLTADNKSFTYFSDLNNDKLYEGTSCTGECVEKINLTKGNTISGLKVFYQDGSSSVPTKMQLTFTRPKLTASVVVNTGTIPLTNVSYVQVSVVSLKGNVSTVNVYASGRVQIN